MSNVLKALKKSEQGYKALENAKAMHMHYEQSAKPENSNKNKDRKIIWLSFGLFILPCIIMIVILLLNKNDAPTPSASIAQVATDSIKLPYPNLESLEPLPEPAPREVVIVSSVDEGEERKDDKFNEFASLINGQTANNKAASNSSSQTSSRPSTSKPSKSTSGSSSSSSSSTNNSGNNIENIDLSEVSPELAALFQQAVSENTQQPATKNQSASDFEHPVVNLIGNEDEFRRKLPAMNLETHIYTSKNDPWVKINGKNLKEKDWLPNTDVRLERILPGSLIIYFDGKYIQIPALYEWKG